MATKTPVRFISTRDERTPLTLPRYTPYTKSAKRSRVLGRTPLPSSRKLKGQSKERPKFRGHGGQPSRKQTSTSESEDDLSSSVAGKSWRVYRASPFYRLKLDKKSLKAYERTLDNFLVREMSPDLRHDQAIKRKTSFKVLHDSCSPDEFAIEIQVVSGDANTSQELVCMLCCGRNDNEDYVQLLNMSGTAVMGKHDLTALPICLIKSTVLLKECFLTWLEGQFGCKLSPVWFSPINLAWLVSLCSGIGEPAHPTELTYQVPALVEGLDTICFNIVAKDAKKLWDSIHQKSTSSQDFFTHEEASTFLRALEFHFYQHFKIHLSEMQLSTVGTSVAYFGKEGRLKILQKKYASYILQQIVSIAHLVNV